MKLVGLHVGISIEPSFPYFSLLSLQRFIKNHFSGQGKILLEEARFILSRSQYKLSAWCQRVSGRAQGSDVWW